jgi:hypothetical protein
MNMNSKTKKTSVLAKLGLFALALVLVFAFAACKSNDEPTPEPEPPADGGGDSSELPNPVVVSSPDEILDKLGFEFKAPDESADKASYAIIGDTTAQLEYSIESGGSSVLVVYRAAKTDSDESVDISGDYNTYPNTQTITLDSGQQITYNTDESTGFTLVLWYNPNVVGGGLSASLSFDSIMDENDVKDIAGFFVSQESKGT